MVASVCVCTPACVCVWVRVCVLGVGDKQLNVIQGFIIMQYYYLTSSLLTHREDVG